MKQKCNKNVLKCMTVLMVALSALLPAWAGVDIPSSPLGSTAPVPSNLVLTPSVEYPTIISVANLGDYSQDKVYVGYFDSKKCYAYHYSVNSEERHFYPYRKVVGHTCSGTATVPLWSGNFLNWAATQTIDPFRKAMTGGYRVKDTRNETWLEKARHDREELFPNRRLPAYGESSSVVQGATPFYKYLEDGEEQNVGYVISKVQALGNRIYFSVNGNGGEVIPYNPSVHGVTVAFQKLKSYELYVRVKVCDSSVGLEDNCVLYPSGSYKPEGLIQEYSGKLRYSIFGYLNDSGYLRPEGGVLRSNQKYVGPKKFAPSPMALTPWVDNEEKEWEQETGIQIVNPNSRESAATSAYTTPAVTNSGVINYLNKFGQMTSALAKAYDPVSEMYYASRRYLKRQGEVTAYSSLSSDRAYAYIQADGFPVVKSWADPFQFWCQPTAILGIGDVYTHRDKNLPGNKSRVGEPEEPPEVEADKTVDVLKATKKIFELEGLPQPNFDDFSGRNNSAYIAGLAYDNRTLDLRPDIKGKQTASTYWVDVRERQTLEQKKYNQYWLAAKYGGFTVPDGYDPYSTTKNLPDSWWTTSGITLSTGDKKPDNFFVASDAAEMVASLKRAFRQLVDEVSRSGSGLAANSTSLSAGVVTFQASYDTGKNSGELKAFDVDPVTGRVSSMPKWIASEKFPRNWRDRQNIYFTNDGTADGYKLFSYENLTSTQKGYLNAAMVDYIRGDSGGEETLFRKRGGALGTIVNSQPVVAGKPIRGLFSRSSFTGGGAQYNTFVNTYSNRSDVVYVGSNDGMLHGFDASSGQETFAFIPHSVLPDLADYGSPNYGHRYLVDGQLTIADAYIGGWKTVLVGTLGAGGRGVFALDVTNPLNVKFLWEKSGADIPALGNVLGKPVIAQVANGDWRVILGNGPNGAGDSSQLIMIGLGDGSVTSVDTGAVGNNGLSSISAADLDGNGFVDTVYAGDFSGRLWRFTGLTSTPVAGLLFHAKDSNGNGQPISATPLVGKHKATGNIWVWVGTGRYLTNDDLTDTQRQTWYGLIDMGGEISGRSELAGRTGLVEVPFNEEFKVRVFPEAAALTADQKGWYVDLPVLKERMLAQSVIDGRVLKGTTRIPDTTDPCSPGGDGYMLYVNPFTGGRLSQSYLDLSRDGYFTAADMVIVDGQPVVVSGIRFNSAPLQSLQFRDQLVIGLENKEIKNFQVPGGGGVTRSSWRELRRP